MVDSFSGRRACPDHLEPFLPDLFCVHTVETRNHRNQSEGGRIRIRPFLTSEPKLDFLTQLSNFIQPEVTESSDAMDFYA